GERLHHTLPVPDDWIGPHHPLAIRGRDVNRCAVECVTPLDANAVEVRVRHGDAVNAAAGPDRRDALRIDEAEAVPEDVAGGSLNKQGALADTDRRIGADPGQAGLEVTHLDPVSFATKLGQSRPALASRWHVLPLVVADRAVCRRAVAGRLLHPAGPAAVGVHRLTIQSPNHGDGA